MYNSKIYQEHKNKVSQVEKLYNVEDLLVSGGDSRLHLDDKGTNYILISPKPGKQILRSSCSGSRVSEAEYKYLEDVLNSKDCFSAHMEEVHNSIRDIFQLAPTTSIITIPSGTDGEYIPLLIGQNFLPKVGKIVNFVTEIEEIGSGSLVAASGKFTKPPYTPSGNLVSGDDLFTDIHIETVKDSLKLENVDWEHKIASYLQANANTVVILHIVQSSKVGYCIEGMSKWKKLMDVFSGKLLIVVDACQNRSTVDCLKQYLDIGCIVLTTGSKFFEGPPFSGAVFIPEQISEVLQRQVIFSCPDHLGDFITKHDVSGELKNIITNLPDWQNWGLMLRWKSALYNAKCLTKIEPIQIQKSIQNWAREVIQHMEKYPELEYFSGGESQQNVTGQCNTIISIKLRDPQNYLSLQEAKAIYYWMSLDMSSYLNPLSCEMKNALKESFVTGQALAFQNNVIIRIALGTKLVLNIEKLGLSKVLEDDQKLLLKLSLLVKNYYNIAENFDRE